MADTPIVLWVRRDFRLADNPALAEAITSGAPVVPVFIDEPEEGASSPGEASRWWLAQAIETFREALAAIGGYLVVRRGPAEGVLLGLARETGATAVYWNRRYEPHLQARDHALARTLQAAGLCPGDFPGGLLFEPWQVTLPSGEPYRLFAPFWKACLSRGEPPAPLPAPRHIRVAPRPDGALPASSPPAPAAWAAVWEVGEAAARRRLDEFIADGLARYAIARDLPDQPGTSRLSPHLAFGEITPRQIWAAVRAASGFGGDVFLRELGWREFCYHMLHFAPTLPDEPLRRQFKGFPWAHDQGQFEAWRRGQTGYPIVDAGIRALRATGWLHNRVRMIVASFLVKDLLLPWQEGEAWFWQALVDADLACNAANWQWVAGCGIDAAPYFRIFNPVLQGEKFDARGRFVRQWVPELAALPDMFIHRPAEAAPELLVRAGVRLGTTYPRPIVDHGAARRRALSAYAQTRGAA